MKLADLSVEQRLDLGERIRQMSDEAKREMAEELGEAGALELAYDPIIQLRPQQFLPPDPEKPIVLASCGRGWGKTHAISRMCKYYVEELGVKQITIAAPTSSDLVNTILFGPSGLMAAYGEHEKNAPVFKPSRNTVSWPNGAEARLIAAESPERSRGINSELLIGDEISSWGEKGEEFFSNLMFGLRLGMSQAMLVTTPKTNPLMLNLYEREGKDVRIVRGTTFDNKANLSAQMISQAEASLKTRLGRQEILAELQLSNDRSLWQPKELEGYQAKGGEFHPRHWVEITIGCDPSGESTSKRSDKFGIVIAAKTDADKVVIIEDCTDHHTGKSAVDTLKNLYEKYSQICPVRIITESNGVGAFFKSMILQQHPFLPIKEVSASAKKYARAMAVSHLYQTGLVFHDPEANLIDLEKEMVTWDGSGRSPNHLDAMVHAVNGLIADKSFVTKRKFVF